LHHKNKTKPWAGGLHPDPTQGAYDTPQSSWLAGELQTQPLHHPTTTTHGVYTASIAHLARKVDKPPQYSLQAGAYD